MSRVETCLWTLEYALLREIGGLYPNFLQRYHGRKRSETERVASFSVKWVRELIIFIFTFLQHADGFPLGEFLVRLRDMVNDDTAGLRFRRLRNEISQSLEDVKPQVDHIEKKIEDHQQVVNLALSVQMEDDLAEVDAKNVVHNFNEYMRTEGILVHVHQSLMQLHGTIEDTREDFAPSFFSDELQGSAFEARLFRELRSSSNSQALRSGSMSRWRFNRTKTLMKLSMSCEPALQLVLQYENFLFETSATGILKWIFTKTKEALIHFTTRAVMQTDGMFFDRGPDVQAGDKWSWEENEPMDDQSLRRECQKEEVRESQQL